MEYIERDIFINNELIPLVKRLDLCHPKQKKGVLMAISKLKEAPAADVVEVRHGKWIIKNDEKDWRDKDYYRLDIKCSICGKSHFLGTTKYRNEYDEEKLKELGNVGDYSYCGNCGAKMDGKDGE